MCANDIDFTGIRMSCRRAAQKLYSHIPSDSVSNADDLEQIGCLAAFEAIPRYDATREVEMGAFVMQAARGAMLDELRRLDKAGRCMRTRYKQSRRVADRLHSQNGVAPRSAEVAAVMGITVDQLYVAVRDVWASRTLEGDLPATNDASTDFGDSVLDNVPSCWGSPEDEVIKHEQVTLIARGINTLPGTRKQVMLAIYDADESITEVASKLGVSDSRVSQLHSSALTHLREFVRRSNGERVERSNDCAVSR